MIRGVEYDFCRLCAGSVYTVICEQLLFVMFLSYRPNSKLECGPLPNVMAALCNRADHYIFALWFLSSIYLLLSFFSSPNLSGHRLDVYHTSAHGVVLV